MSATNAIALPAPHPRRTGLNVGQLTAHAIVLAGALLMLAPFYFMFIFATHSDREILSLPPPIWFGNHFDDNLKLLLERLPYWWQNLGWSVYVALAVTAANLLLCSLAGYAFAMFEFRYKKQLFVFVMGTMLLPSFVAMIPTALIMSGLGWMNQPKALIVPAACGALGIFMMRQYIASAIPRDLLDAARIDGCSELGIYFRIVLPLIGPALGTLGLVTFIASWNNFMGPLIVMRDMEMYTVPLALRSLQGTGQTPWGAICAGSSIAVLPLLVMFALASRRLIEGLTAGAVKA
ncbi:carbohydrate ABC transporter permease [Piscinibacter gummiphilus]|uniref:Carbohydrate ABC transporter permease n=1 Tax=Piscinibacter gummiphilus TaxID=946333 RepID=A0ABZ0CU16_9BURK|nr:carbohydrate ABC transporter permease [Piscinibacter gummiphilus]WOB08447.1 carbohydrate ABC transporter permease [Piscinibacter gummiphilus]